jgi:hypothetical protein
MKRMTICVLMLAGILSVGCDDKKEPAKPAVPTPPTPDVTPKASNSAGSSGAGEKTGGGAIATTAPSTTQTPDPSKATAKAKVEEPTIAPVPSTQQATQTKKAQELLSKASAALSDNRLDDAQSALDQADAMKSSLAKAQQDELTKLRANLEKTRKLQQNVTPPASDPDNK